MLPLVLFRVILELVISVTESRIWFHLFLTLHNIVEKDLWIRFICLSCIRIFMKFLYVIKFCNGKFDIENQICSIFCLFTEAHKRILLEDGLQFMLWIHDPPGLKCPTYTFFFSFFNVYKDTLRKITLKIHLTCYC